MYSLASLCFPISSPVLKIRTPGYVGKKWAYHWNSELLFRAVLIIWFQTDCSVVSNVFQTPGAHVPKCFLVRWSRILMVCQRNREKENRGRRGENRKDWNRKIGEKAMFPACWTEEESSEQLDGSHRWNLIYEKKYSTGWWPSSVLQSLLKEKLKQDGYKGI